MIDSFCDQSSYELLKLTADGLKDQFVAMCQELDERESLPGEDLLLSYVESALDATMGALGTVGEHTVEELVWPVTESTRRQNVADLAKRIRKRAEVGACDYEAFAALAFDYIEGAEEPVEGGPLSP